MEEYVLPLELLNKNENNTQIDEKTECEKLENILKQYDVNIKCISVSDNIKYRVYEVDLKSPNGKMYRINDIKSLITEIGMFFENVKKITVERIKNKNTLGIYMEKTNQETLLLGTVLEKANCENFQIPIIIGVDKDLNDIIIDLYKIPHFLVAGTTGSGKTNFLNNIFVELIHKFTPNEQRFILIDTRGVNFPLFNKIPHLLIPTITEKKKALGALAWLLNEMENRYQIFQKLGAKDLNSYNNLIEKAEGKRLPQICVFIDDVSDLMDESNDMLEECLIRLSQKSRAAGIYLILATYRPSVSILNGIIKANIVNRLSFRTATTIDSISILDEKGAEKLDKGEALFKNNTLITPEVLTIPLLSEEDINNIINYYGNKNNLLYNQNILEMINKYCINDNEELDNEDEEVDPFLDEAIESVIEIGQVSTSFIQRRFKVGYARAERIIDQMEKRGIVSGYAGSRPREVLISKEEWNNISKSEKGKIDSYDKNKMVNDYTKSTLDEKNRENKNKMLKWIMVIIALGYIISILFS